MHTPFLALALPHLSVMHGAASLKTFPKTENIFTVNLKDLSS